MAEVACALCGRVGHHLAKDCPWQLVNSPLIRRPSDVRVGGEFFFDFPTNGKKVLALFRIRNYYSFMGLRMARARLQEHIMTITLNTTCFTVQRAAVVEGTLADFDHFIERTTRPTGVGYKYYATTVSRSSESDTDDDGNEVLPAEEFSDVWVLAKWATWGGPEVVVREFDTEDDARAAAEESYVYDILHNSEMVIHLDRDGAVRELAQQMEDDQ